MAGNTLVKWEINIRQVYRSSLSFVASLELISSLSDVCPFQPIAERYFFAYFFFDTIFQSFVCRIRVCLEDLLSLDFFGFVSVQTWQTFMIGDIQQKMVSLFSAACESASCCWSSLTFTFLLCKKQREREAWACSVGRQWGSKSSLLSFNARWVKFISSSRNIHFHRYFSMMEYYSFFFRSKKLLHFRRSFVCINKKMIH